MLVDPVQSEPPKRRVALYIIGSIIVLAVVAGLTLMLMMFTKPAQVNTKIEVPLLSEHQVKGRAYEKDGATQSALDEYKLALKEYQQKNDESNKVSVELKIMILESVLAREEKAKKDPTSTQVIKSTREQQ